MIQVPKHLELFTDGGAIKINNEYYGSCSFEVKYKKQYFTFSDPVAKGTNNFYELKAIRDGLRFVVTNWKQKDLKSIDVWIISDSQYSISCITEWFDNWYEKNGKYYTRSGKEVSNIELILEIRDILTMIPKYKFLKIRSHISHDIEKTYIVDRDISNKVLQKPLSYLTKEHHKEIDDLENEIKSLENDRNDIFEFLISKYRNIKKEINQVIKNKFKPTVFVS